MPSTSSSSFSSVDERQHLLLGRRRGQPVVARLDPGALGGLVLLADVDVRGRVVADEHRREARAAELLDLAGDLGADPRRQLGSPHQRGAHRA